MSSRRVLLPAAVGLALALVLGPGGARAAPSGGLPALVIAAGQFVGDQCADLGVDRALSTTILRDAGVRPGDPLSAGLKAEVAALLTEWRGTPRAACDGLVAAFGPDGRAVRNLVYRAKPRP